MRSRHRRRLATAKATWGNGSVDRQLHTPCGSGTDWRAPQLLTLRAPLVPFIASASRCHSCLAQHSPHHKPLPQPLEQGVPPSDTAMAAKLRDREDDIVLPPIASSNDFDNDPEVRHKGTPQPHPSPRPNGSFDEAEGTVFAHPHGRSGTSSSLVLVLLARRSHMHRPRQVLRCCRHRLTASMQAACAACRPSLFQPCCVEMRGRADALFGLCRMGDVCCC